MKALIYAVIVFRDITEEFQIQEQFQKMMNAIHVGLVIIEADSNEIFNVNPAFCNMIDAKQEDIIEMSSFDENFRQKLKNAVSVESYQDFVNVDIWIESIKGEKIPVLKTVIPVTIFDKTFFIETFVDISILKQTESRLRESESNFRMFFESLQDLIFVCMPDGRVRYTNSAVNQKLGYSYEELKTKHVLDLHPENVRQEAQQIFNDLLKNKREYCPLHLVHKNGTLFPVETRAWIGKWNDEECLFGISKDPFKLFIMEINNNDTDINILVKTIRSDELLKDCRMIAITSSGVKGDYQKYLENGFSAYLTHPIRHDDIKRVLEIALSPKNLKQIVTKHTVRENKLNFLGSNARILLAEDNITNQQVGLGILKKMGIQADAVANGKEAIEALKLIPYDIVLMDVQMPEMDAIEATIRIRSPHSTALNPDVPIIALTANAMKGDREKCIHAGMNAYLTKPLIPKDLYEILSIYIKNIKPETISEKYQNENILINQIQQLVVWNKNQLYQRMMHDESLVLEVIKSFIKETPVLIQQLKENIEKNDAKAIQRTAHTIKGMAANFCAEQLQEIALTIEKNASREELNLVKNRIPVLENFFYQVKEMV